MVYQSPAQSYSSQNDIIDYHGIDHKPQTSINIHEQSVNNGNCIINWSTIISWGYLEIWGDVSATSWRFRRTSSAKVFCRRGTIWKAPGKRRDLPMDWFRGTFSAKPRLYLENLWIYGFHWVPLDFPLNQPIDPLVFAWWLGISNWVLHENLQQMLQGGSVEQRLKYQFCPKFDTFFGRSSQNLRLKIGYP